MEQYDHDSDDKKRVAPAGSIGEVWLVERYTNGHTGHHIIFDNGCWVVLYENDLNEVELVQ